MPYRPLACTALLLALAPAGIARAAGATVLTPAQADYAALSSAWWAWLLAQPRPVSPVLDTSGKDCAQGQAADGPWFLAGTLDGAGLGPVTRACTVPAGRALLVPVLNPWADNFGVPGSKTCPPGSRTEQQLRKIVTDTLNQLTSGTITVDGAAAQVYRIDHGDVFSYDLPSNNIADLLCRPTNVPAAHVDGAVSGGYYALLAPLPAGAHTLRIQATTSFADGFAIDVTYDLTVG
jgi:hypothetical protein